MTKIALSRHLLSLKIHVFGITSKSYLASEFDSTPKVTVLKESLHFSFLVYTWNRTYEVFSALLCAALPANTPGESKVGTELVFHIFYVYTTATYIYVHLILYVDIGYKGTGVNDTALYWLTASRAARRRRLQNPIW